jgi:LuxR family maltose regulon positive regulatory protein
MSTPSKVALRPSAACSQPIPAPAACLIDRERLNGWFDRLREADSRVLCVWGPAGAGKTTLLAQWARKRQDAGDEVIWRSGSEPDEPLARAVSLADLMGTGPMGTGATASIQPGLTYIFVDDVHLLSREADRTMLGRLAEFVPSGVRLVMAGRYQPFRSLTFLQATGTMLEIRASDLAFDRAETERLALRHRIQLPPHALDLLLQRTAGWATGLALAMPWLEASPDPQLAVGRFDGDNRAVADYLVSEIVESLSDDDRVVLMAAAVRDVIPLDLAVLLGKRRDAGAILQRLSRRNTLIVQEDGNSFRYHPILLSFMRAEARRRDVVAAADGHLLAARWFADRGDEVDALEQAILSRRPSAVLELLDRFGLELLLVGKSPLLTRALGSLRGESDSAIPQILSLLLDAPYFSDARRARHLVTTATAQLAREAESGRDGQKDAEKDDAEDGGNAPSGERTNWRALLTIARILLAEGDHELTRGLVQLVSEPLATARRENLSIDLLAATAEGWCLARLDRSHDAVDTFRAIAQTAHGAGYDWLFMLATDLAATAAGSLGDWLEVTTLEDQLGILVPQNDQPLDRASARALLATAIRAYQRCDDVADSVLEKIAAADPLGSDLGLLVPAKVLLELPGLDADPNPRAALDSIRRIMWAEAERQPRALASCCVRLVDLTNRLEGRGQAREIVELTAAALGVDSLETRLARFLLSSPTKLRDGSEEALEAAVEHAERPWHLTTIVHAWIALAQVAELAERHSEADARLTRALQFAERFHLERPFLAREGLGAQLVSSRIGRFGHLDDYARRIESCATRILPATVDSSLGGELLTPRERELLRELPMHQTVSDIATKLSLSSNTVKTHLRSIYQKLGASDRAEAVFIAHSHGLV